MPRPCTNGRKPQLAEQQADLLRRLSQGARVNEAIDWSRVSWNCGHGQIGIRACESLPRRALVRLLKVIGLPNGPVGHWRSEARGFLADAKARFTPAMRQRIDLPEV